MIPTKLNNWETLRKNQSNFDMKAISDMFDNGSLFDLITYFMTFTPMSAQIKKMAKYPLTNFSFSGKLNAKDFYKDFFTRHSSLSSEGHTLEEIGLETLGFGNSFVSLYIPFVRTFKCEACGRIFKTADILKKNKKVTILKKGIEATCPNCKKNVKMAVKDTKNKKDIHNCKIIRWPLSDMDIKYVPFTGARYYYYSVPSYIKTIAKEGKDLEYLDTVKWQVLYAAKKDKVIKFKSDAIFHMRCPSINGLSLAWGMPLMMPSMPTLMHIQQLRKANDVAAEERSKARDVIYPMPVPGVDAPALNINMQTWGMFMKREQNKHKQDPGRTTYSPVPVGKVSLGGDARALMVYPEIKQSQEED